MKTELKKIDTRTTKLGNSDLAITPVGFGAWGDRRIRLGIRLG